LFRSACLRGLAFACVLVCSVFEHGCAAPDVSPRIVGPVVPVEVALDIPGSGTDAAAIQYEALPKLSGVHSVVSPPDAILKFQLHSYLLFHDGLYWCMWSQGPPSEDEPTQQVRYATSVDGVKWSDPQPLTGAPKPDFGYIARGFWVRDGKLLALVAHFRGKGAFGVNKDLELRAFEWNAQEKAWKPAGTLFEDAINNFPPEKLRTGEWMMSRRDSRFNVYMLAGGVKALDDWDSIPVVRRMQVHRFIPDEPIWWSQPDGRLVSLYRDNGGSTWLFRSVSTDNGRNWSTPVATNFPNTPSKLVSLALGPGCRALISNANPKVGRRELYLSTSPDGLRFTRMARLDIPSARPGSVQYPHAIVHDGYVLITFSRNKADIEVLKIPEQEVRSMCAAP